MAPHAGGFGANMLIGGTFAMTGNVGIRSEQADGMHAIPAYSEVLTKQFLCNCGLQQRLDVTCSVSNGSSPTSDSSWVLGDPMYR
jgi:hypothetical protein